MRKPRIYLAGAIRDEHKEDVEWREEVINSLREVGEFINPMARKRFQDGVWTLAGVPATARMIVKNDFWALDNVDAVLFNFRALSQGYPNIGSLVEFGRATARGLLLWAIIDPAYQGHNNLDMYKLHPFLEENCAVVFPTVSQAIAYLREYLPVMSGRSPHFEGVVQSRDYQGWYPLGWGR